MEAGTLTWTDRDSGADLSAPHATAAEKNELPTLSVSQNWLPDTQYQLLRVAKGK